MNKISKIISDNRFSIYSFLLASAVLLAVYALMGIYPFGANMVVKSDLLAQFVPFHEELRERLFSGRNLIYSWEGSLGKSLIPQIAYYTASPFSFLIILFPRNYLAEGFAIVYLLKISASAFTFTYFIRKSFGKSDLMVCMFSLLYAFMAFVSAYHLIFSWMDAIILLPLVALGIEYLVKDGRYKTYIVSLALTIIINYYLALFVCAFSVFYFIMKLFTGYSFNKDKKIIVSKVLRFGFCSLVAGGLCMFLALPAILGLNGKGGSELGRTVFYPDTVQILTGFFVGAEKVVLNSHKGLPNIYAGVLTVLLLPFYFTNKKIERKEKIFSASFLTVLLLGFCIESLSVVLHGFYRPAGFPHRYSFLFSFYTVILAYKSFICLDIARGKKLIPLIKVSVAMMALIVVVQKVLVPAVISMQEKADPYAATISAALSDTDIAVNILLLIVYVFLLYMLEKFSNKPRHKVYMILTAAIVIAELVYSSYPLMISSGYRDRQDFLNNVPLVDGTLEIIDKNETDTDFYRTELRRRVTQNDSAYYHYNGIGVFSSAANADVINIMKKLGVATQTSSIYHYDATPLVNSIVSLKYLISLQGSATREGWEYVADKNNAYLYENKFWLPLGFMVDEKALDWDTEKENPFDVQRDFALCAAGIENSFISDIPITAYTFENIEITNADNNRHNFKYNIIDPKNLAAVPKLTANAFIEKPQRVFVFVEAGDSTRARINVDGNIQDREIQYRSVFDIGSIKGMQEISIEVELAKKASDVSYYRSNSVRVYVAGFDLAEYEQIFNELNKNPLQVTGYGDGYINGTVNAEEDGILFTSIPYDAGWKLKVDGRETKPLAIAGEAFIGIPLEQGAHDIALNFTVRGLVPGVALSVLSLLALIFYRGRRF